MQFTLAQSAVYYTEQVTDEQMTYKNDLSMYNLQHGYDLSDNCMLHHMNLVVNGPQLAMYIASVDGCHRPKEKYAFMNSVMAMAGWLQFPQ